MAQIVDGKKLAQQVVNQLKKEADKLIKGGIKPKLVIVGIQPDTRSQVYIRMKLKRAEEIGIDTQYVDLGKKNHAECIDAVQELSNDNGVHGIVLQLPLAGWYDPQDLIDYIDPNKDVDGLTSTNQTVLEQNQPRIVPATPMAVMQILREYNVDIQDKVVAVIGRSHLVGMPLRYLLEHAGARVLVGHRQIKDIAGLTKQSDIVISAAGSPGLLSADMIKSGAIVIDVGINDVGGRLKGDVDFDSVKNIASIITPVPGGVGPLTVVMILQNVLHSARITK
ncbi:MAG: methylenetetrahydrofolate dehydrogenase / methenyltetrahydrofolate cyclohydrolase [Patescibacteria group bacterium]|jgi:methylenetetrahydrofolate dehydrogenase (NADP+)/methenyltetrahydrofolate cyclohydrolase|nr:methylenetetrahydrofolate dehydrogenase / methenyltetrahydrofolate cyclohydrolase [Patescibacteria group bacterium]